LYVTTEDPSLGSVLSNDTCDHDGARVGVERTIQDVLEDARTAQRRTWRRGTRCPPAPRRRPHRTRALPGCSSRTNAATCARSRPVSAGSTRNGDVG
jgi:hypothetical protein